MKSPFQVLVLFLIGGAAVVVTVAFFLWNDSQPRDSMKRAPQGLVEDDVGAGKENDLSDAFLPDDEAMIFEDEPPEEMVRIELPREDERRLVVEVRDGKSGAPAGKADVFFLDGFEGPELSDPFAQHWSDLAGNHGRHYTTDPNGRVSLPAVMKWGIVTAQRPGEYGFIKVGQDHPDVEKITLQADETVTVRVVDSENHPVAGVPVGILQHVPLQEDPAKLWAQIKEIEGNKQKIREYIQANPGQREAAMGRMEALREREARLSASLRNAKSAMAKGKKTNDSGSAYRLEKSRLPTTTRSDLQARRRTGKDGVAVFRHFQVYRHEPENWWPRHRIDQFEAVLLIPLLQPESCAFSGRPVPAEPLDLRMPQTGSIALRTVDLDGRPFTHPVFAELRLNNPVASDWTRLQVRKEQDEDKIVFPFAGLGLEFTAHCRLDDNDFRWNLAPFHGPSSPEERITLDLIVAPGAGMLFGRLLDEGGKPLSGVRPTFLINSLAGRLEGEEITCDRAGRFHLPYKVSEPHVAPFRLEIRRNDQHPTEGLTLKLPALPESVVTDLGDLRIGTFARIAHGVVLDDREQPVKGAKVQLQHERMVGGKERRLEFVDESFSVCETDSEGRYELFGELETGRYMLKAQAKDHFPCESPDLAASDRPVDMILLRKARVVGTVLPPSWMPSRNVRVRLESVTEPEQRRDDQVRDYVGKKFIYFDWVRPGIYNVLIRIQEFPDPFLEILGLEVLPGHQGIHPRLQDLDLRSYLYRFDVAAVDERGRPLHPGRPLLAKIVRPDGQAGFVGIPWRNARAEIFSVDPSLEVVPLAKNRRAVPAVLVHGRSEICFHEIEPLEVHVPGLREIIGATPAWIGMRQVAMDGLPGRLETWDRRSGRIARWYRNGGTSYASLGEDNIARVTVTSDGTFRVTAYIGDKSKGINPVTLGLGSVNVRIDQDGRAQRATVKFDSDQLNAALDKLNQREMSK